MNDTVQKKTFAVGLESAAKNVAWMREVNNMFTDLVNSISGNDNRLKEGRPEECVKQEPSLLNTVFDLNEGIGSQIRIFEENVGRLRNSLS